MQTNAQRRHIALLCNPTVAKAIRISNDVANLLKHKPLSFQLFTAYWPTDWSPFTEAWLVGGDGTVNFFINQNPRFKLPIALLAGGTGNDLHRTLYGKTTVATQVETFSKPHTTRAVDAGMCNGTLFLNGVGIGFDGAVAQRLHSKTTKNKTAYWSAIAKTIFAYRERPCRICYDGKTLDQPCFMISVANGTCYGGGFQVAPKAMVNDGLLDVAVIGAVNVAQRLRYLPVMKTGKHLSLPFVRYAPSKAVVIEAAEQVPAHVDGEYFCARRFEIRCLPNRFTFLA